MVTTLQKVTKFEVLAKRKILQVLKIIHLQDFDVPLDVLFSNEFLRDLSRLWELRTIVPDPSNPTLVIR